jgi:hypothetical protein
MAAEIEGGTGTTHYRILASKNNCLLVCISNQYSKSEEIMQFHR